MGSEMRAARSKLRQTNRVVECVPSSNDSSVGLRSREGKGRVAFEKGCGSYLQILQNDAIDAFFKFRSFFLKFRTGNEFRSRSSFPPPCGTSFALGRTTARIDGDGTRQVIIVSNPAKDESNMANRRNTMLWMKDLIEHMAHCHDQLQWAGDGPTQAFLADSLLGDLSQCRQLCEQLRQAHKGRETVASFDAGDASVAQVGFRDSLVLS
jgi:hypothetical protein